MVAAFQAVTGKHITVPEHHEVTGAIGCCLIAMENAVDGVPSKFKGWQLSKTEYLQTSFECKSCANACEINKVQIDGGETLVYGGRCEKFEKKKSASTNLPDLFAERESLMLSGYEEGKQIEGKPYIGIPRALHFMDFAPYWISFFKSLDIPIKFSSPTNKKIINDGLEAVLAEFCFPVKVAHGHVMELMEENVTHLFLPCIIQLPKLNDGFDESVQCPYVSTLPYSIQAALDPEKQGINILAPAIDLSDDSGRAVKKMYEYMKELGVSKNQIAEAMKAGRKAQSEFSERLIARGKEILKSLDENKPAVVIISRGYNGCDNGINLELPERFKELDTLAIPLDMMPFDEYDISDEYKMMSWRSGQKILTSAEIIRKDDRLHGVYVTNFGCGPDSFLLKFFRDKLGGKSFLQIEIDEHSSDVGALTRCEAFLDSFKKSKKPSEAKKKISNPVFDDDRTLYIPNMNNAADIVAAAFRSVGISAQPLPETDKESVAIGKKYCTGKECFPCIVTTGDIVKFISRDDIDTSKAAFFMPSISGSGGCRFGCYNILHRIVLDDLGYNDIPVFSPNQSKGFYESLGAKAGKDFVRKAWQGLIASELLEKALYTVRPMEAVDGSAYAAYRKSLDLVIQTVEKNGDLVSAMKKSREYFEAVQTNSDGHMWIGIVGEVFVRSHDFSNSNLIELIEESGGKAWLSPLSEWLYYVNLGQKTTAKNEGRWLEYINVSLIDKVMKDDEKKLVKVWEGFIPHAHELTPEELVELGKEYIDPEFFGEPILSLGKSEYLREKGLAGIINVMPFTCMLGTITNGLLKNFQPKNDGMPVLNLAFDGQEVGDLPLRLEAFMEQCKAFKNKN
ncbi:MAG: acyl-CoA dehydratase activase-related protein [Armatimonadota bacterium]